MFVTIFKAISSGILVLILISLIIKRDLTSVVQNTLEDVFTTPTSIEQSTPLPVTTLAIEQSSVAQEALVPELSKPTPKIIVAQNPVAASSLQIQKIPTETVYEEMTTSHSDTDESYKPTISPCKLTMGFTVGAFDTRFGITKEEFIQEIESSATAWEDVADKNLFKFSPQGPLTINLIFDERQAMTVDISYLALEIENSKIAADAIKNAYEKEKDEYTQKGQLFTTEGEVFKANYKAYEDKVAEYNAKGGATQSEYDAMMILLAELQSKSKSLEEERQKLLFTMESINQRVARYSEFITYINSLIKKSNSLGVKKFTEGRFVPSTNTIDIYQFTNRLKLRRVITHELGHVMGINHNDNAYSIMYSINAGTSTVLTNEDIQSLKKSCDTD